MLPKIGREPLSEQAYKVIKEAILNHQIKPKDILLEDTLAEMLGISRTPLRAALQRLEYEKLVVINSSKHAIVAEVGREDLRKIFELRLALEPVIARHACAKMTDAIIDELEEHLRIHTEAMEAGDWLRVIGCEVDFDFVILKAADNEFFTDVMKMVKTYMHRFLVLSTTTAHDTPLSIAEHTRIVAAFKARDCQGAEVAVREHLNHTAARFKLDPIVV